MPPGFDLFWEDHEEISASIYLESHKGDFDDAVVNNNMNGIQVDPPTHVLDSPPSHSWDDLESIPSASDISNHVARPLLPKRPPRVVTSPPQSSSPNASEDRTSIIQDFTVIEPSDTQLDLPKVKRSKPAAVAVCQPKELKTMSEMVPLPLKRSLPGTTDHPKVKKARNDKDTSRSVSPIEDFPGPRPMLKTSMSPKKTIKSASPRKDATSPSKKVVSLKPITPPTRKPSMQLPNGISITAGQVSSSYGYSGPVQKSSLSTTKASDFSRPSTSMSHTSIVNELSSFTTALSTVPNTLVSAVSHPSVGKGKKRSIEEVSSSAVQEPKRTMPSLDKKTGRPMGTTTLQYIGMLNEGLMEPPKPKRPSSSERLKGHRIFFVHDCQYSMTDRNFDVINKMFRHGATLVSRYDPDVVTHIVCMDSDTNKIFKQLGIKKISQIPITVPTLRYTWVTCAIGSDAGTSKNRWPEYAAFPQRKQAGQPKRDPEALVKQQAAAREKVRRAYGERKTSASSAPLYDRIDSTDDHSDGDNPVNRRPMTPPRTPPLNSSPPAYVSSTNDPLAPFYDMARAAAADSIGRHGETGEDDSLNSDMEEEKQKSETNTVSNLHCNVSGWTCDRKPAKNSGSCPNQDIIDKLEILKGLHEAKPTQDDKWRAFTYTKVIRILKTLSTRITSLKQARSIKGIGDKTALKIMEIINTGDLRRIGHETTEDVVVTRIFTGIYGVGPKTAYQWFMNGYRTLDDLKANREQIGLSVAQNIGLDNYNDINSRMPREEAGEIFSLIRPIALNIDPKLDVQIMGSYRRGKKDCGDIDIMITRDNSDGRTHRGVLPLLLDVLKECGLITDDLAVPDHPEEDECIYRGLCKLPKEGAIKRRIDFLCIPWESRGAALIYYTGDDIFNRAMRYKANHMGYSLNQRGLWAGVVRDPRDRTNKLATGSIIVSSTEHEIFSILGVPWQEPSERVRNFN